MFETLEPKEEAIVDISFTLAEQSLNIDTVSYNISIHYVCHSSKLLVWSVQYELKIELQITCW